MLETQVTLQNGVSFNPNSRIRAHNIGRPHLVALLLLLRYCLLSSFLINGRECFPSVQEKYLAVATCRHLATIRRTYNDDGSIIRDAAEGNLNSINLPEYHQPATSAGVSVGGQKRALFDLARYKRACIDNVLRRLQEILRSTGDLVADKTKGRQMVIWKMFYDVTDLFGQVYMVRDIASWIKRPTGARSESGLARSPGTAVAT